MDEFPAHSTALLGPSGSSSSQHRRTPGIILLKDHASFRITSGPPLGPLGFNFSQHGPTTRPSIYRTADKASLLSDRVYLSHAEACVKEIVGGSVGVGEGIPTGFHAD